MNQTTTTAYFCPICSSPAVEISLSGITAMDAPARCRIATCGWTGTRSALLATPVRHNQGSDDRLIEVWSIGLRNLYAKHMGKGFAEFLRHWGFIPDVTDRSPPAEQKAVVELFARYVAAMGAASARALLETRDAIEAERVEQEKKGRSS